MSTTHVSSSSVPISRRSSMKPNFNSPISLDATQDQKHRQPTVRFADVVEPLPISPIPSTPNTRIRQQPGQSMYSIPTLLPQYQYHRRASVSSQMPTMMRTTQKTENYVATRPNSMVITRPKRLSTPNIDTWSRQSHTIPPTHSIPDSTRSSTPLSTRKSASTSSSASRVTSYNSNSSRTSMHSASTVRSTPPDITSLPRQYDPLQHYVPCLDPTCSAHYTPPHAGSMYYVPQGSYSLTRLHGYCPQHVTKELADATAQCKLEWETMRQSAGRKTLGQIDQEFDTFMERFREERQAEDAQLQQNQRDRLVSAVPTPTEQATEGKSKVKFDDWNWRYTPRRCTTSGCKSSPYSPYANHLYSFYTIPQPSKHTPLSTLCPACAKAEVETFEQKVAEKWSSRSEWDNQEWSEWLDNVTRDREMEVEFGEKAQEKAVRGKVGGPARREDSVAKVEDNQGSELVLKKRRSVFRRLFSKGQVGT